MNTAPRWELGSLLRLLGGAVSGMFLGGLLAVAATAPMDEMTERWRFSALIAGGSVSLGGALWLVLRPWPFERLRRNGLAFFALLYVGVFLSAMAQRMAGSPAVEPGIARMVIPTLLWQGVVLLLVARLLHEQALTWADAFGLRRAAGRVAAAGMVAVLVAVPILWALQWLSVTLLSLAGWTPRVQAPVDLFAGAHLWSERVLLAGITLVLAPVCEEVLFRGILYPALKQTGRPRLAFWMSAIVFALVHFHVETFVPLLALACLLNLLYDRTGNLLACVAAHSAFNAVNLGMILVIQRWYPHLLQP